MGAFVSFVSVDALRAAVAMLTGEHLLRISFVLDDASRLTELSDLLSERQLDQMLQAAVDQELWRELDELLAQLGDTPSERLAARFGVAAESVQAAAGAAARRRGAERGVLPAADPMTSMALIDVSRNGFVESRHRGSLVCSIRPTLSWCRPARWTSLCSRGRRSSRCRRWRCSSAAFPGATARSRWPQPATAGRTSTWPAPGRRWPRPGWTSRRCSVRPTCRRIRGDGGLGGRGRSGGAGLPQLLGQALGDGGHLRGGRLAGRVVSRSVPSAAAGRAGAHRRRCAANPSRRSRSTAAVRRRSRCRYAGWPGPLPRWPPPPTGRGSS